MKPRRRILRNLVLGLSVLSIVAVGWLWVRSYHKLDEVSRVSGLGVIESIVSFRGGLHFSQAGDRASERGWSWDAYTISPGSDWDVLYFSGVLEFRRLGFGWLRGKPFNGARVRQHEGLAARAVAERPAVQRGDRAVLVRRGAAGRAVVVALAEPADRAAAAEARGVSALRV